MLMTNLYFYCNGSVMSCKGNVKVIFSMKNFLCGKLTGLEMRSKKFWNCSNTDITYDLHCS